MEGIVDLTVEVERLRKEENKTVGEIKKIDVKLGNTDFIARAPEDVVEQQRERRDTEAARLQKIREALARLKDADWDGSPAWLEIT